MGDTVPGMRVKVYDDTPEKAAEGFYNLQKMHIAQAQYAGAVLGRYSIVRAAYDEGSSAILPTQIVIGDLSGHFYRLRDTGDPFVAPESDTYNANGVGTHWDDLMLIGAADYSTQEKGIQDWKVERQYTHPVLVVGSDQLIYGSRDGGDLTDDPVNGNTDNWLLYEKLAGPVPVIAAQMRQWERSGLAINPVGFISNTDITINTGAARDFSNAADLILPEAMNKGFDQDWQEGSNEGGYARGVVRAPDKWHYVFLIGRIELDGTVTTDVGFDDDPEAATLLNQDNAGFKDFTLYRRIGRLQSQLATNFYKFQTLDDGMIEWSVPRLAYTGGFDTSSALFSLTGAPGTTAVVHLDVSHSGLLLLYLKATSTDQDDTAPSASDFDVRVIGVSAGGLSGSADKKIKIDQNGQARIRANQNSAFISGSAVVVERGFYDSLDY